MLEASLGSELRDDEQGTFCSGRLFFVQARATRHASFLRSAHELNCSVLIDGAALFVVPFFASLSPSSFQMGTSITLTTTNIPQARRNTNSNNCRGRKAGKEELDRSGLENILLKMALVVAIRVWCWARRNTVKTNFNKWLTTYTEKRGGGSRLGQGLGGKGGGDQKETLPVRQSS